MAKCSRKKTPVGRMPKTAIRVERTLRRHKSYPRRRAEQSIIGDLAAYEWQLEVARQAFDSFLNMERGGKHSTFVERLAYLKAAIESLRETTDDLQPELTRLLKRKGGIHGELLAVMKGLSDLTAGFSPRSEQ